MPSIQVNRKSLLHLLYQKLLIEIETLDLYCIHLSQIGYMVENYDNFAEFHLFL